jgi:hypothetical protein
MSLTKNVYIMNNELIQSYEYCTNPHLEIHVVLVFLLTVVLAVLTVLFFIKIIKVAKNILYSFKLKLKNIKDKNKHIINNNKYIEIFNKDTKQYIYYFNELFFEKINSKYMQIPFDSPLFNEINFNKYHIYKRTDNNINVPQYMITMNLPSSIYDEIDYTLTAKFTAFHLKCLNVKQYIEKI